MCAVQRRVKLLTLQRRLFLLEERIHRIRRIRLVSFLPHRRPEASPLHRTQEGPTVYEGTFRKWGAQRLWAAGKLLVLRPPGVSLHNP